MKKKKALKIGCISGGLMLAVIWFLLFPSPVYFMSFGDGNDCTEPYRNAKQITQKEAPARLTEADWKAAGVVSYTYQEHLSSAEGEFVPFRIRSKKAAHRAALACADILELDDASTLRYSPSQTYLYQAMSARILGWKYYAFIQYYQDIPVWNSIVLIRTERFGKPAEIISNLVYGFPADLPAEPKITADEAKRAYAKGKLEEPMKQTEPMLMYCADADGFPVLAWIVQNDWGEAAAVNAVTGELLPDPEEQYYEEE